MRVLSIGILLLFTTSTVAADTYTIYGIIKYPNNTAVQYEEIEVQCEPHAYDCAKFSGEGGMSDFGGGYRMELPVEDQDEGVSIQLVVRGEIFEHQITLNNETQDGSDHHVMLNITLEQEPPHIAIINRITLRHAFFHSSFCKCASENWKTTHDP